MYGGSKTKPEILCGFTQGRYKKKKTQRNHGALNATLQNVTLFHSQWESSTDFHKQGKSCNVCSWNKDPAVLR